MKNKRTQTDHGKAGGQAKKGWIVFGLSLLLFTVLLISLFYFAENRAEKNLLELANKELSPNTEVVIDHFSLSLFPIGVSIKGVQLLHHPAAEEVTPIKPADAIQHLSIEEITLSGIRLQSLIRRDHLHVKKFILRGLDLGFVQIDLEDPSDSKTDREPIPITVSDVQFSELNITLFDHPESDSASTSIQNLSGKLTGFFLPDPSEPDSLTFEDLEITINHFSHFTENGFYEVSLDSFRLDTVDDHITLRNFKLKPLMSARKMALDVGHPIDKFDLQIPGFKIEKVDINRWLTDQKMIAETITLSDPILLVSRDNSLPRKDRGDRLLPHVQFKNLPFSVSIDSILAKNGTLHYYEEISDENRGGTITFTEIDLTLSSLANHSATPIFAEATALFMDQSDFDLNVEFSLDDAGRHTVSGNLYQFDLTAMNSTFENLVLIRVRTGEIHQLNFQFQADDDRSSGDLILIYSDLDIRFIDIEEQRERRRDRVRSYIANTFVIRDYNSADNPRPGEIAVDRDKERSIFNFWLRSISTGLIDTIKR